MNRIHQAGVAGLLLLVCVRCAPEKPSGPKAPPARRAAAAQFTKRYEHSRFAQWQVEARPAGRDCAVLLIETGQLLDRAMVETMEYGAGSTEVFEGGAMQFRVANGFRGGVYRDAAGKTWSYDVSQAEADTILPCR